MNINIYFHGLLIRLAAYRSTARNAFAALTRLKSGFNLAEMDMRSPVLAELNLLFSGTRDRYSAARSGVRDYSTSGVYFLIITFKLFPYHKFAGWGFFRLNEFQM